MKAPTKTREPTRNRRKPVTRPQPIRTRLARRADFGLRVDGFFKKQPVELRAILEELRGLIIEAAPMAEATLKWGMPFYTVAGRTMCGLTAHKSHVNLVLAGPAEAYPDPTGLLSGSGRGGRHLKLTRLADLPRDAVLSWLHTASGLARNDK